MTEMRHPEITVQLIDTDGNAFAILGKVGKALRAAGVLQAECDEFMAEAMSGSYDHLLATCMKWVNVAGEDEDEYEDEDDGMDPDFYDRLGDQDE